jgi:hypothetical protein
MNKLILSFYVFTLLGLNNNTFASDALTCDITTPDVEVMEMPEVYEPGLGLISSQSTVEVSVDSKSKNGIGNSNDEFSPVKLSIRISDSYGHISVRTNDAKSELIGTFSGTIISDNKRNNITAITFKKQFDWTRSKELEDGSSVKGTLRIKEVNLLCRYKS